MGPDTLPAVWTRHPGSAFLVATDRAEGRVVGCVAVTPFHTFHKERAPGVDTVAHEAAIFRLAVDPTVRRRGLGRALMLAAHAHAASHGATHVSLYTGNEASKAFYRSLGYTNESLDRALLVLYGPTRRPKGLLAPVKVWWQRRRVAPGGTTFVFLEKDQ